MGGLHYRLDISYNDDRCRVQRDNGILILAMYRRIANSLLIEWRQHQRRPEHVTTTDFQNPDGRRTSTESPPFRSRQATLSQKPLMNWRWRSLLLRRVGVWVRRCGGYSLLRVFRLWDRLCSGLSCWSSDWFECLGIVGFGKPAHPICRLAQ